MLYSINTGEPVEITKMIHKEVFDPLRDRLSEEQFESIRGEISRRIEGKDTFVSNQIPPEDWDGTALEFIPDIACPGDRELGSKFFGLIFWYHMMKHPDAWSFQKVEQTPDGEEGGTLYFRINLPQ